MPKDKYMPYEEKVSSQEFGTSDILTTPVSQVVEYVRMILPILCTIVLFVGVFFVTVFPTAIHHVVDDRKQMLRDMVLAAMTNLEELNERVETGELTLEAAQAKAKERIRRIRFGEDGGNYLWLNDLEPKMIMHPYRPDFEGQNLADYVDVAGKRIFIEFAQIARESGEGYSSYYWQWQGDVSRVRDKLSYVKLFKPWGWVLGTGVYMDDMREAFGLLKRNILLGGAGIFALMLLFSGYIAHSSIREMRRRRKAELRLCERERVYRTLTENMDDGIMRIDRDLRHLYASPSITQITGIPREQFIGKKPGETGCFEDLLTLWEGALMQVFESGEKNRVEFQLPNGRWVDWLIIPELDGDGQVVTLLTSARDVTERRNLEREHNRLALVIEQAHEYVIVTDTEGTIEYVNPAFERGTGYAFEEVIGKKTNILKSGKHDVSFYEDLWRTIKSGHVWKGILVNRRKNGTEYYEDATITPLRNEIGDIINFVAVKRDVTHEHELERQLQQAQKMEAIGTLAGGIAHDFNNILSAILGHTELTLLDLPEDSELRESLEEVMQAGRRATELVQQILTFSRRSESRRSALQVSLIVKEALRLIRSSLPASIEINQYIDTSCPMVNADPTQIHQVLMNLCTNAFHSMEERGGTLTVRVACETIVPSPPIEYMELKPGRYVVLTVTDTGCGMSKEITERIFDPFFTTKSEGRGTGMGLATVHGIVQSHDGHIAFSTDVGKGTEFRVYFPVMEKGDMGDIGTQTYTAAPQGNGELIAIIDDEPAVIVVLSHMLSRDGYCVATYPSALEFLVKADEALQGVSIIISDSTMPKLSGIEFAGVLRERGIHIPVILMTGLATEGLVERANNEGIQYVLKKPIDHKELMQAVANAISG